MRIAHLRFVGSQVMEPAQRMGEGWLWPSVKISPTRRDSLIGAGSLKSAVQYTHGRVLLDYGLHERPTISEKISCLLD